MVGLDAAPYLLHEGIGEDLVPINVDGKALKPVGVQCVCNIVEYGATDVFGV